MKIKKLIYTSAATLLLALPSCEKWLDINHNPNNPETVAAQSLVAGAEMIAGYNQMAWECLFIDGVWNQYFTQKQTASQFKTAEQYYAQEFSYYYANSESALLSLKTINNSVEENSGYKFLSEVLSIYIWQNMVDTWGDIPYSEALNDEITSPRFDAATDIYKDLLSRIDMAITNYENDVYNGESINENNDFIFEGDIEQWYKFANSLKLKLNLRLSEYSELGMTMAEMLSFISDESKFLTEDNAQISSNIWQTKSSKQYPLDEYENGSFAKTNIVASKTFTEYTNLGDDPRAKKIFSAVNGKIEGALQGDYQNQTQGNVSALNKNELVKNIPLISTWEVYFNFAEIYAENEDLANAKTAYENAVKQSLDYWGVSDYSILTNANYASWDDIATDKNNALRLIGLQRWVAFAMTQHNEAFFTRNRTKYPALSSITPSDKTRDELKANFPAGNFIISFAGVETYAGEMPASAVYPLNTVLARNINAPSQKSNVTVKIFWDTKQTIKE